MNVRNIAVLMILAGRFSVPPATAPIRPAVELEGAIAREQVDGDLKMASAVYRKIAADNSAGRDVRAKALLHLASCYEKMGLQAAQVYGQITREFADEPAAAEARRRLAALSQDDRVAAPGMMTLRKIEQPDSSWYVYPNDIDGHHAFYRNDWARELAYGDLAARNKRVIFRFKPSADGHPWWFPSRDFSLVLLLLRAYQPDETVAIINADGTGYREIAHPDAHYDCWNWSWDSRYMMLCGQPHDGISRLMRFAVADGQIREVVHVNGVLISPAQFSPDGQFVAYQVRSSAETDRTSRIFIVPARGGQPQLIYEERQPAQTVRSSQALTILDWTADGRYLAIATERMEKGVLLLLPVKDGKSAGAPVFVMYGGFETGITKANGGLIYESVKSGALLSVYLAALDANSRPGDWKRLDLHLGDQMDPWPRWDGGSNQIVYSVAVKDPGQVGYDVHVRDISTGEDRRIYRAPGYVTCNWAAAQPAKLFCVDHSTVKSIIFSLATDSGQIVRLHTFSPARLLWIGYPSPDDRAFTMFEKLDDGSEGVLRCEMATGREAVLEWHTAEFSGSMSSDEHWLVRWRQKNIEIRPTGGGSWRLIVTTNRDLSIHAGQVKLTPDGRWILYHDVDSTGSQSLFRVSTAGGSPERLGDFPTPNQEGFMQISPDGKKILVSSFERTAHELWSLDNFIPAAKR